MTDMQGMLLPPLDDEEESSHNNNGTETSTTEVLPPELQDRFAKVRSLMREKAVNSSNSIKVEERKRKQQEAALETAQAVHEEMARLQNGIAELEAMYSSQQRSQQQHQFVDDNDEEEDYMDSDVDEEDDGILLGEGDHHYHAVRRHPPAAAVDPEFPALPSAVAANAVEPESEVDDDGNIHGNHGSHICNDKEQSSVQTTEKILCNS